MKYLKNAFELYINSSIHVSLAVVAFTLITILENDLEIDHHLLNFIFVATVTGYNFVKYAGIAKLHHLSLAKNLRFIQIFSLICFLALIYLVFQLKLSVLLATAILGAFTVFYAIPIPGEGKSLRSLPGLKIFIIGVVWAGSTVLLPLIDAGEYLSIDLLVDFFQRFMLVMVLTLPFEIRDLNFDDERLGTIPQKLGVYKTKVFGSVLMILIFSSEILQDSFKAKTFLALVLMLILSGVFLWKAGKDQGKYYSSFWVESLPLIYVGIYLLLNSFLLPVPF